MDIPPVTPPDADARRAAVARHDELAVPLGGLGRLAELGCWLAAAQGTCPPRPPARPRVVVFAADHGIAVAGVSRHAPGGTLAQVAALRDNTAAVTVLVPVTGASVRLVDVGLDRESTDPHHVRRGSGRIDREDALTAEEADRAFAAGRAVVDEEVDAGADLLVPASLGVGASTAAATLVSVLAGVEPVAVIGRGSGIDDVGWMRKAAAVRDARRRAKPHLRDPLTLLRTAGGADLAALAGFLVQAAVRRTPALLDGVVVGAAAMVADELAAGARDWWLLAQRSPEPGLGQAAERLGLTPLLDLELRTGDGTGALAALPLLEMAARLLAETATEQAPPAESPPAESPPAESPPAESPPAESPPAESPPAESPPAESPPAESPPADPDPAVAPGSAHPHATSPGTERPADPLPADPLPADPLPADPPHDGPPTTAPADRTSADGAHVDRAPADGAPAAETRPEPAPGAEAGPGAAPGAR